MGCSVVVYTNAKKSDLLVRCIESLSEQTYEDKEIICVSTVEALPEEVQSIARIIVERRRGVSIAKNGGIRAAKHDIIALTDDDCVCEPEWVEKLVDEYESDVGCVTGGSVPTREGLWYAATNWHPARRVFKRGDSFYPPWLMGTGNNLSVRKEAITDIGLFNEELGPGTRYRGAEDVDVFYKITNAGYDVVYTPEAIIRHEPLDTRAQVRTMMYGYRVGLGAFFAKHRYSVEAIRFFKKQFLRSQLRDSRNTFLRGNLRMGLAYFLGYVGALRGYYGYILAH